MQEGAVAAVESVLAQDVDISVVLVDDFSDPPITLPPSLLADGRVSLVRHEENRGAAAARNTGVTWATSDWIGFLDADDRLIGGTLGMRLDHAREVADNPFALSGCGWIEPDTNRIRLPNEGRGIEDFSTGCWYSPGSCVIGRKRLFEEIPFETGYPRLEDLDWAVRFGLAGGVLRVLDIAGAVIAPGYNSRLQTVEESCALIRRRFARLRSSHPDAWENLQAYLHLEQARSAHLERRWGKTAGHMLASFWHRPRMRYHLSPGWSYRPATGFADGNSKDAL